MKKIAGLILTSSFPRYQGDTSGNFVFELGRELSKYFEIYIATPHVSTLKSKEIKDTMGIFRFRYFFPSRYECLSREGGLQYNLKNSWVAKIQLPMFLVSEFISTFILVTKLKIQFVNSHWLIPQGFIGALCSKILKVNHIATIHSSEVTIIKKLPFGKFIAEFTLKYSDAIISVSKHRMNELYELISPEVKDQILDRVHIIPMGVDLSVFDRRDVNENRIKFSQEKCHPVILFVGRLVEVKGCEFLIRAMPSILGEFPDAKLLIAGGGPLEQTLNTLITDLGLQEHVVLLGSVKHEEIPGYYFCADIVAIPSIIDDSGYQEGLPVVAIEALAARRPVVASNIPGIAEVIEDGVNGLLVRPKDSEGIAEAVKRTYHDHTVRNELLQPAEDKLTCYSWENVGIEYRQLIEKLTSTE